MTRAKLFVLGQEIELLWCNMNYYRGIRKNGKPATEIMGGLITLCYATDYYSDLVLRWMTKDS
ncbi:MAG: type VI secretion system tube protein TssD, partial [Bacteroidota bacterium]